MQIQKQKTAPYQHEIVDDEDGSVVLERVTEEHEAKAKLDEHIKLKVEKAKQKALGLSTLVDPKQKETALLTERIIPDKKN
jgi:hypothetical protein